MSEPTKIARVYDETEIGRILQRAAELQHREPSAPAAGVTLAELEEIAAEAGIDPAFLKRAATELESGVHPTVWTKVLGDELRIIREVTLSGDLPTRGFERVVELIHENVREHGTPSLLGQTLTWRAETASKSRTVQIVVASRDGETRVRVEENLTQMANGLFGGVVAGGGLGLGLGVGLPVGINVLGSALMATLLPIGITAVTFIGTREIYRHVVNHRRRKVADLFDMLVGCVGEEISSSATALPPVDGSS